MAEALESRGYGVGMPGYDREKWGEWGSLLLLTLSAAAG
jgi:hypothetical protein